MPPLPLPAATFLRYKIAFQLRAESTLDDMLSKEDGYRTRLAELVRVTQKQIDVTITSGSVIVSSNVVTDVQDHAEFIMAELARQTEAQLSGLTGASPTVWLTMPSSSSQMIAGSPEYLSWVSLKPSADAISGSDTSGSTSMSFGILLWVCTGATFFMICGIVGAVELRRRRREAQASAQSVAVVHSPKDATSESSTAPSCKEDGVPSRAPSMPSIPSASSGLFHQRSMMLQHGSSPRGLAPVVPHLRLAPQSHASQVLPPTSPSWLSTQLVKLPWESPRGGVPLPRPAPFKLPPMQATAPSPPRLGPSTHAAGIRAACPVTCNNQLRSSSRGQWRSWTPWRTVSSPASA